VKSYTFKEGLRDSIPICLGYLSVSFAFGIFAFQNGLSVLEALLISVTNVTSAGQLAGVPIIAGGGTLIELAMTQLFINLRYALMSVSLSQKFDASVTMLDRFIIAFVNTDEVFAVSSGKENKVSRNYMFGLILPPFLGWSFGTLLGALVIWRKITYYKKDKPKRIKTNKDKSRKKSKWKKGRKGKDKRK